jgi:hypothetical protein
MALESLSAVVLAGPAAVLEEPSHTTFLAFYVFKVKSWTRGRYV